MSRDEPVAVPNFTHEVVPVDVKDRIIANLVWLRYGVFLVFLGWTLDKFLNPGHATKVFQGFYGISLPGNAILFGLAALELAIILAFLAGLWKTYTYGFVLVFHGISTLSSYEQYIPHYGAEVNLLFFAAWPMLAACWVLFVLRDLDTRWTLSDE